MLGAGIFSIENLCLAAGAFLWKAKGSTENSYIYKKLNQLTIVFNYDLDL
jgi:hypothetical protein